MTPEMPLRHGGSRKGGRYGPGDDSPLLIIADSETNADLYYATSFRVAGAVVYIEERGHTTLLVSDLEYGRARAEAKVDAVVSTSPFEERLRAAGRPARLTSILDLYLRDRGKRRARRFAVPASLPFVHAQRLRGLGYSLRLREDPLFPQRTRKRPWEVRAIAHAQERAEEAMALAAEMIRASAVRGGLLYHPRDRGEPLTSERVRIEIRKLLLEKGYDAPNTIVAGGDQGADPHSRGTGPLRAHETIIIDIFPRSSTTWYWGDMSRTFVKGRASPAVRKLHRDVLDAQELVFPRLRPGAEGQRIHEEVVAFFKERGNAFGEIRGRKTGFIHGTGHGIGLEVHEPPRISRVPSSLAAGHVVTVEPGLYYPGVGAVRLEDVVVITGSGSRNLNRFPKELEM